MKREGESSTWVQNRHPNYLDPEKEPLERSSEGEVEAVSWSESEPESECDLGSYDCAIVNPCSFWNQPEKKNLFVLFQRRSNFPRSSDFGDSMGIFIIWWNSMTSWYNYRWPLFIWDFLFLFLQFSQLHVCNEFQESIWNVRWILIFLTPLEHCKPLLDPFGLRGGQTVLAGCVEGRDHL